MSHVPAPTLHRVVFISDVHLGSRHCHAADLPSRFRELAAVPAMARPCAA